MGSRVPGRLYTIIGQIEFSAGLVRYIRSYFKRAWRIATLKYIIDDIHGVGNV